MGTYSYTFISAEIPSIPVLSFQLTRADTVSALRIDCKGILDTGSDVTLVPLPLIMQLNLCNREIAKWAVWQPRFAAPEERSQMISNPVNYPHNW